MLYAHVALKGQLHAQASMNLSSEVFLNPSPTTKKSPSTFTQAMPTGPNT